MYPEAFELLPQIHWDVVFDLEAGASRLVLTHEMEDLVLHRAGDLGVQIDDVVRLVVIGVEFLEKIKQAHGSASSGE
jgi:hypothetical protein